MDFETDPAQINVFLLCPVCPIFFYIHISVHETSKLNSFKSFENLKMLKVFSDLVFIVTTLTVYVQNVFSNEINHKKKSLFFWKLLRI